MPCCQLLTMDKEITIEEAKNQKTENLPMFQTYYVAFTRYAGSEWFAGMASQDKRVVIDNVRTYNQNSDEVKIVSFQLPF